MLGEASIRLLSCIKFLGAYPGSRRYQNLSERCALSMRETIRVSKAESFRYINSQVRVIKGCMDRTIPFYTERIVPEARSGSEFLSISSSENAIRGL
jgi:bisphosphoglycerate-dependent phosphoglycerate mutase